MRSVNQLLLVGSLLTAFIGCSQGPRIHSRPEARHDGDQSRLARTASGSIESIGRIEPMALFYGPMPTGVAVSRNGRMFVNFPRWGDPVEYTVAEIVNGRAFPFPDENINRLGTPDGLVSVQSVVIDAQDRLWILDTGSIDMQPVQPGAPKLLCVDLRDNRIVRRITFPQDVVLSTTYLNDIRFDLRRGEAGMAFITDSSDKGPNGIIVVDLAQGTSWRKLHDHPSTNADPDFVPVVEDRPLMVRQSGKPAEPIKIGSDGIAIDVAQGILYYCPLGSRRLHSVSVDALANRDLSDQEVAQTIRDLPRRDFASDGLDCDEAGTLYLTDYEHNAIQRLTRDGRYEIVASDARMIWPDSISIRPRGDLYFTANQLNRQPKFHEGRDLRQKPYVVFRTPLSTNRPVAAR